MCKRTILLISFVLMLSIASVANADIKDGLLVSHNFSNLSDDSGNGHDAVLFDNAYISSGLLRLDGNGDYADIGTIEGFGAVNPMVDGQLDFTVAVIYASTQTGTEEGESETSWRLE